MDGFQYFIHTVTGIGYFPQVGKEFQIVEYGHIRIKRDSFWHITDNSPDLKRLFHNIEAIYLGGTRSGGHVAGKDAHGGRFSGPVRTKNCLLYTSPSPRD